MPNSVNPPRDRRRMRVRVHPARIMTKLQRLDALLRRDPQRAKVEILRHLDGDLMIVPRPSSPGERRAEISGCAKAASLLRDQEAVCLEVVAGARNHRKDPSTSAGARFADTALALSSPRHTSSLRPRR